MPYPLALTRSERLAYERALAADTATVRYRAQLYNRSGNPLPIPLDVLDGEVVVDATNTRDHPTRTAGVTLHDPNQLLALDSTAPFSGGVWFSHSLRLTDGIWVDALSRWVDVPVFHGPISDFSRHGDEVEIDAQGKEAQHLAPHYFFMSFAARRHWRIHHAIQELLEARGEKDFNLDHTHRRLARDRTWPAGAIPWRAAQNLASAVDRQLFVRGDGTFRLRSVPENPVWVFGEGPDSILVDYVEDRHSISRVRDSVLVIGERTVKVPVKKHTELNAKVAAGATSIFVKDKETFFSAGDRIEIGQGSKRETRKVTSRSGNQIFFTGRALSFGHPKGAPVTVNTTKKETRPVIGRAELGQNHHLSSQALTGGKRPRIKVDHRPGIHKVDKARRRAKKQLHRMKLGLEREISFSCVPVFHLEELDQVGVEIDGRMATVRLERFTIPQHPEGVMDVNWVGRRVPRRRRRRGK